MKSIKISGLTFLEVAIALSVCGIGVLWLIQTSVLSGKSDKFAVQNLDFESLALTIESSVYQLDPTQSSVHCSDSNGKMIFQANDQSSPTSLPNPLSLPNETRIDPTLLPISGMIPYKSDGFLPPPQSNLSPYYHQP